jgi:hypothetical protein
VQKEGTLIYLGSQQNKHQERHAVVIASVYSHARTPRCGWSVGERACVRAIGLQQQQAAATAMPPCVMLHLVEHGLHCSSLVDAMEAPLAVAANTNRPGEVGRKHPFQHRPLRSH